MAAVEAQKQVEESVTQILKSVSKADKAQYRQLVKRLSKFLPTEASEKKANLLAKSGAKNATATKPTKPKTAEQLQRKRPISLPSLVPRTQQQPSPPSPRQ